jgi:multiple antibiotic resistance protein
MIEWTFIIKTTIALIAIVDPIGCLPLFFKPHGSA